MNSQDNPNIDSVPKPDAGDVAHTLVKAGISAIPYIGGPVAELFSLVITPSLERRRDEWIKSIADGLKHLEEKSNQFRIENLATDEVFITTVLQASQAALRNHQKEKLEALRNAVLNAALPNRPEEDLQLLFLNFVESLAPWHLRILAFLDDPKIWGKSHRISYPTWTMGSPSNALEIAFPELHGKRDLYDLFTKDLYSHGLLSTDSLHSTMSEQGIFASRTTDMGKQFIKFVSSPL